jgi:hypothetical protein
VHDPLVARPTLGSHGRGEKPNPRIPVAGGTDGQQVIAVFVGTVLKSGRYRQHRQHRRPEGTLVKQPDQLGWPGGAHPHGPPLAHGAPPVPRQW